MQKLSYFGHFMCSKSPKNLLLDAIKKDTGHERLEDMEKTDPPSSRNSHLTEWMTKPECITDFFAPSQAFVVLCCTQL